MIYKKQDFNNCQFNPMMDIAMVNAYPLLSQIIEPDWCDENLDSIIRYAIMVYDPKSPMVINERDLSYRKNLGIEFAHVDPDIAEAIIHSTHKYSGDFIYLFIKRFIRSREWAAIYALDYAYWESIKEVVKPITGKNSREILDSVQKKAVIKQEIVEDIKRLDILYRTFYGEDDELQSRNKRRLTPELIAGK